MDSGSLAHTATVNRATHTHRLLALVASLTCSLLPVFSLCPRGENQPSRLPPCTPWAWPSRPGTRQLLATYLFSCNLRTHFSWSPLLFPLRLPSSLREHRPRGASVLTVGHRGVWERDFGRQMPRVGCSGLCPVCIPVALEGRQACVGVCEPESSLGAAGRLP